MKNKYKIVYFENYCKDCKYEKLAEEKEPCSTCLDSPVNEYSHRPTQFVKKGKKGKNREKNKDYYRKNK